MKFSSSGKFDYKAYLLASQKIYKKPLVQVSIELMLTLLTVAFFGTVAIKPTLSTIAKLQDEISEKTQIDNAITKKLNSLNTAQEIYLEYQQELKVFDVAIPPQKELEQLLMRIEVVAKEQNLTLRSLGVESLSIVGETGKKSSKQKQAVEIIGLRISAQANYEQLLEFLTALTNLDRYIQVRSISFSEVDDRNVGDNGVLQMSLSLESYWLPESKDSL